MAQGSKYDDKVREKAMVLLATNMSAGRVAEKLGVAESTVRNWKRLYLEKNPNYLTEVRTQKRAEFEADAWADISRAQKLLSRKLERAEAKEDAIDQLIAMVEDTPTEELSREDRKHALRLLKNAQIEDVGKLATTLAVLYDKAALAAGESTVNLGGTVGVTRLEDV